MRENIKQKKYIESKYEERYKPKPNYINNYIKCNLAT